MRRASPLPGFFDVTGGEYKIRERIQRNMADLRLLAIPTSWSRVADSNLNWGALWWDLLQLALSRPIVRAIVSCV